MRYYLGFVVFGLLMGSLCVLLELHAAAPAPTPTMFGLFGAVVAAPAGLDCLKPTA